MKPACCERTMPGVGVEAMLRRLAWLACLCASVAASAADAPDRFRRYLAVPLGTLGGGYAWAVAINGKGAVAGTAATAGGALRAFVHDGATMSAVGDPWVGTPSYAQAISDAGHVAGYAIDVRYRERAFLVEPHGTVRDLGALGGGWSRAYGVNAQGHVVGETATGAGSISRAFLYHDGSMTDLGTLGGSYSAAYAINARGEVTGSAEAADGTQHAFVVSGGVMARVCRPTDSLPDTTRAGMAINESSVIAGRLDIGKAPVYGPERAFAFPYAPGGNACGVKDLGTLGGAYSHAFGINNHREIVGEAQYVDLALRAFVQFEDEMRDLNALVVSGLGASVLTEARAINDAGQIAASSCGGPPPRQCTAFRLDPVPTPAAIEYYHATFGHYFVSTLPDEIAALDSGLAPGWERTRASFRTYPAGTPGTTDVCRFWSGQTYQPKSSHHYAPQGWSCAVVLVNRDWVYEGNVFAMVLPDAEGGCADGTTPLYQFYNNGVSGAPNHRYTTSEDVRKEMLARGWTLEGMGKGVIGCVPGP